VAPRLGDLLVEDGACTAGAVRDALRNQVIFGGRLGTNLLELQAVGEEALAKALGRQHGVPSLSGALKLDARVTRLLPPEVADRCDAVPYLVAGRRLAALVVDPGDLTSLDELAFASGKQVHAIVAPEARVWALLREAYGIERNLRGLDVEFGRLGDAPPRARDALPDATGVRADGGGHDLMGEDEFETLYANVLVTPSPAREPATPAPPPDDVIELTELLEPEAEPQGAPPRAVPAEILAALSREGGHAPPPRLARPAPRREEPEPSPLGFDEAVRFLEGVDERGAIANTVLRYARSRFRRAVLLTVQRGVAHGWAGLGEKLGAAAVRQIHVPLGTPGIVDTVVRTRAHFLGPIPKTDANIRLLRALGGGVPGNAFLVPILAMGRVVNVFYADGGKGAMVDASGVGELLILATRIAKSYDALLARVR
jgi:hypothetical protein